MPSNTSENSSGSNCVGLSLSPTRRRRVERVRTQVLLSLDILQKLNELTNGEMMHIISTALTRIAKKQIKDDNLGIPQPTGLVDSENKQSGEQ